MKLRNKRTGEIVELESFQMKYIRHYNYGKDRSGEQPCSTYNQTLAELNEEWEDYQEPKDFWYIDDYSIMCGSEGEFTNSEYASFCKKDINKLKQIGNYFKTEEEAKKAVEKLESYNKLRQKGFVFSGWYYSTEGQLVILADNHEFSETELEDLTKLFGDKIC